MPTYTIAVASTSYLLIFSKIFLKSNIIQSFHHKWMGYIRTENTSWLILFAQTTYFIENVLGLTFVSGVFLSHFDNHYSKVYLSFAIINALVRFFVFGERFLETLFEEYI